MTLGSEAGLRHEPALDGLRGMAVAAVVAFHLGRLDGGFLGVDLFFVLSGFLITSLLVTEHRAHGRIGLGRFWVRRARRLLPALFGLLVGVAVLLVLFTPEADRGRFRGDALATLGYVANWHRMAADTGYWDIFSQPSPLDHTWSLAIEEQFYLLWPLLVVAILGWARLGVLRGVAFGGAGLSFLALALTYAPLDTNRAYYGTDTRIGATLLGAGLATVLVPRPRRSGRAKAASQVAGLGALAWIGWSALTVDGVSAWYYRGGLATFAVAVLVVIGTVTGGPPSRLAAVLSWRPLRWLGTISYGVYLWHWPVIVYLTPERTGLDSGGLQQWALDGLRVASTLLLATVSYRLVELPIRQRHGLLSGRLAGRRLQLAGVAAVAAVAVTVAAVLVATGGRTAASRFSGTEVPVGGSTDPALPYPEEISLEATRVLLVGDSGVAHLGPEFAAEADRAGLEVATSAQVACTIVVPEGRVFDPTEGVLVEDYEPCHDRRRQLWTNLVQHFDPDIVVLFMARAGGVLESELNGQWLFDCDPAFDDYLAGALHAELDLLQAGGARVVIPTSPYIAVASSRSGERTDCRNATYRQVAAGRANTTVVELGDWVFEQVDADGFASMYIDSVHFSPAGAKRASQWLIPRL